MTDEEFLKSRGVCVWCHQHRVCCIATPDDSGSHDRYWRINNVTSRRPWWSNRELVRIIKRDEYVNSLLRRP